MISLAKACSYFSSMGSMGCDEYSKPPEAKNTRPMIFCLRFLGQPEKGGMSLELGPHNLTAYTLLSSSLH